MRILYTSPTSQIGGAEMSLLALLGALPREEVQVQVACPGEGPLTDRLSRIGVPHQVMALGELSRRHLLRFVRSVLALSRAARAFGADILHSNGMTLTEQTYLAGRLAGAKVACHVRDLCPVLGARWLRRYAFNHADCVIAISAAVQRDLVEKLRVRPSVVRVVHNGVDLSEFDPEKAGRSDFFAGTPIEKLKRVGVLGRLSREKGQEHFLSAAALVAQEEPNVGFAVVGDAALGDGDYARRLGTMVREFGLGERTLLTGFAERAADVMRALDLVVVPSDAEPFGRVTIEAMASGKPVVATKTGGSPEIVIDGETGLLVPPRDPAAIAEAVLRLLRQPGMTASMGAEGRRQATERFSIEEHGRTIRRLYEGLLQGGQGGGELAI